MSSGKIFINNTIGEVTLHSALRIAKNKQNAGDERQAAEVYISILKKFPKNRTANVNLKNLQEVHQSSDGDPYGRQSLNERLHQMYSNGEYSFAIQLCQELLGQNRFESYIFEIFGASLLNLGQFDDAVKVFEIGLKSDQRNIKLMNGLGLAYKNLGNDQKSIEAFLRSLNVDSENVDALNNLGNLYKRQSDFSNAQFYLRKVVEIEPSNANFLNNLAAVCMDQEKYDDAISLLEKALDQNQSFFECKLNLAHAYRLKGNVQKAVDLFERLNEVSQTNPKILFYLAEGQLNVGQYNESVKNNLRYLEHDPDNSEAVNNLGVAFYKLGDIEKALYQYTRALLLDPNLHATFENLLQIRSQLISHRTLEQYSSDLDLKKLHENAPQSPQILAYQLIDAFKQGHKQQIGQLLSDAKKCMSSLTDKEMKKEYFFIAYSNFISSLSNEYHERITDVDKTIYHFGDSHCLTYANRMITNQSTKAVIKPVITFGAKAYHFTTIENNQFKAITKLNFVSIEHPSTILISFGEIDCRADEGIITAVTDKDSVSEIIKRTVSGYVGWFNILNREFGHELYFVNVPAPKFKPKFSKIDNQNVSRIVEQFNAKLSQCAENSGNQVIDVYSHTVDVNGFSNGKYHVDEHHLSPRILELIEI